MSEQIVNEENVQALVEEDMQAIEAMEPLDVEINVQIKSKKRARTENRNKHVECDVCFREMRSDTLKRHMLQHQELPTLDEDEIRNEMKRRQKLQWMVSKFIKEEFNEEK